jgi:hypothetical protein
VTFEADCGFSFVKDYELTEKELSKLYQRKAQGHRTIGDMLITDIKELWKD